MQKQSLKLTCTVDGCQNLVSDCTAFDAQARKFLYVLITGSMLTFSMRSREQICT